MTMKNLTYFFYLALLCASSTIYAQTTDGEQVDTIIFNAQDTIPDTTVYKTWETPIIGDDMTVDPDLNKAWREGQSAYSAKPKNMWELGIHLGHFFIDGDVDRTIPGGFGAGLHLRKAIHYVFSIRLEAFYGMAWGLDPQPWRHGSTGGGLVEEVFDPYGDPGTDGVWFPSHRTTFIHGNIQTVINIGNLLFHKERNKWNWYATIGVGLSHHKAMLDMLDGDGNPYSGLLGATNWNDDDFDTRQGRLDIKDELRDIYDGDFETEGFKKKGIFRIGDETNIHFMWTAGMGIARKIGKRFNIGIEHQLFLTDNDYLDGIKFRTAGDQTNNVDIGHYTSIRLAFNLGSFSNRTEPLYWLNPMDAAFNDIAALKRRPELDLTDSDGDGVINMIDLEINSPEGAPVDTRGITLDSDGDGYPDYKDAEPYSPPGFEVDKKGIAIVPEGVTKEEVVNMIDNSITNVAGNGCCRDWFLPMIHFDLDNYCIKPEYYPHVHHVATVMRSNPDLCVTVHGHTDNSNNNDYNMVLSYNRAKAAIDYMTSKYGISRDRFKLMYGGEESPLVSEAEEGKLKDSQKYLNRRVEFRVCEDTDVDMGRPEGPEAGNCDEYKPNEDVYTPVPKTPVYRGAKNSGF